MDRADAILRGRDLEIDNNAVERAIRSIAVGPANWMFIGCGEGGKTAAVLRLVASCQRVGVDPFAWLKHVVVTDHNASDQSHR